MRILRNALLVLLPIFGLLGAGTAHAAGGASYLLATASTGGTFYPVGVALGTLSKIKLQPAHGFSLTAITSAGSAENLRLMREEEAAFAILQGIYGAWAWHGQGRLEKEGPQSYLRSVSMLWLNVEHFVVLAKLAPTGTVTDLGQLAGKPFSIGPRNSGSEGSARQILGQLGIDADQFSLVYVGYSASAEALRNGTVVGMNTPAGAPVAAVTQAFAAMSGKLRLLEFSDEQLAKVNGQYPLWSRFVIPAGTYPGQDKDVATIAQPNFLAVHENVDEEHVYRLTKAIYENLVFLRGIHKATASMSPESAIEGLPAPLHPGALRYYREAGLTVPEELTPPGGRGGKLQCPLRRRETFGVTEATTSPRPERLGVVVVTIAVALAHLYFNTVGLHSENRVSAFHFASFAILSLLLGDSRPSKWWKKLWHVGVPVLACSAGAYLVFFEDALYERGQDFNYADWLFAVCAVAGAVELTRRTSGWVIPALVAAAVSYVAWWGKYVPGVFSFPGLSLESILFRLYFSPEGMFGLTARISWSYVFMFMLFGSFLLRSGGGDFVVDLARAVAGRLRGGPGYVAVVASGLMGSISGSAIANTAATGTITIPLTKRTGFSARFAGAVEAAASTGGQLMPPVMGAGAFIMASYTQVSYLQVISVALLPAVLYFATVVLFVRLEAGRQDLVSGKATGPGVAHILRTGWRHAVPLVVLMAMLIRGVLSDLGGGGGDCLGHRRLMARPPGNDDPRRGRGPRPGRAGHGRDSSAAGHDRPRGQRRHDDRSGRYLVVDDRRVVRRQRGRNAPAARPGVVGVGHGAPGHGLLHRAGHRRGLGAPGSAARRLVDRGDPLGRRRRGNASGPGALWRERSDPAYGFRSPGALKWPARRHEEPARRAERAGFPRPGRVVDGAHDHLLALAGLQRDPTRMPGPPSPPRRSPRAARWPPG